MFGMGLQLEALRDRNSNRGFNNRSFRMGDHATRRGNAYHNGFLDDDEDDDEDGEDISGETV